LSFATVGEISEGLSGAIGSAITVMGIIMTIFVFTLVFPYIVQIVGTTISAGKQVAGQI